MQSLSLSPPGVKPTFVKMANDHDPRTVFVSGIGADLGERDLEEAFSEIGPVRRSFLVGAQGTKTTHTVRSRYEVAQDCVKAILRNELFAYRVAGLSSSLLQMTQRRRPVNLMGSYCGATGYRYVDRKPL